jgi:hypothetical protein
LIQTGDVTITAAAQGASLFLSLRAVPPRLKPPIYSQSSY